MAAEYRSGVRDVKRRVEEYLIPEQNLRVAAFVTRYEPLPHIGLVVSFPDSGSSSVRRRRSEDDLTPAAEADSATDPEVDGVPLLSGTGVVLVDLVEFQITNRATAEVRRRERAHELDRPARKAFVLDSVVRIPGLRRRDSGVQSSYVARHRAEAFLRKLFSVVVFVAHEQNRPRIFTDVVSRRNLQQ